MSCVLACQLTPFDYVVGALKRLCEIPARFADGTNPFEGTEITSTSDITNPKGLAISKAQHVLRAIVLLATASKKAFYEVRKEILPFLIFSNLVTEPCVRDSLIGATVAATGSNLPEDK